ncbi:MAG TPA: thermonuclease family protein [Candidatus Saccharimonadales bacterium]|nr:thermonuclease family protein [Candidatus Saccharimonadales bacterium]
MEKFLLFLLFISILGLVLALFSPLIYKKIFTGQAKTGHEKLWAYRPDFIVIFIVLIGAIGVVWQNAVYDEAPANKSSSQDLVEKPYPVYSGQYDLIKVIKPASIAVNLEGTTRNIKLIGLKKFTSPHTDLNECLNERSKTMLNSYLHDKKIELSADDNLINNTDGLLLYVTADGTDINKKMIAAGYARAWTANTAEYQYEKEYLAAQKQAKSNGLGLWSESACKPHRPATPNSSEAVNATPPAQTNPQAKIPSAGDSPAPSGGGSSGGGESTGGGNGNNDREGCGVNQLPLLGGPLGNLLC